MSHLMLRIVAAVHTRLVTGWSRRGHEAGQTSAEYALVLLGAGAIALLVLGWATQTNKIGRLLDGIFGQLLEHVDG